MPVSIDVILLWYCFMCMGKNDAITEYTILNEDMIANIVNITRPCLHGGGASAYTMLLSFFDFTSSMPWSSIIVVYFAVFYL